MELLNALSPASAAEVIQITPSGVNRVGVADFSTTSAYNKLCLKFSDIMSKLNAAKNK